VARRCFTLSSRSNLPTDSQNSRFKKRMATPKIGDDYLGALLREEGWSSLSFFLFLSLFFSHSFLTFTLYTSLFAYTHINTNSISLSLSQGTPNEVVVGLLTKNSCSIEGLRLYTSLSQVKCAKKLGVEESYLDGLPSKV
jgi:hypothetical protein